jgi:hypothetical protein
MVLANKQVETDHVVLCHAHEPSCLRVLLSSVTDPSGAMILPIPLAAVAVVERLIVAKAGD